MEVPVALLLVLEAQLFLEQAAALAQLDDVVIQPVQPLGELTGPNAQPGRKVIRVLLIETMEQHAQAGELAVQPDAGPAQPAQGAAHFRLGVVGKNPLFDAVDLLAELVGHPIKRVGDLVDDLLQQMRDVVDAIASFEHAARGVGRAQRLVAAADQQVLGHGEAQEGGLFRRGIDVTDEIREYAVDAMIDDVELLKGVVRQQELARQRRQC